MGFAGHNAVLEHHARLQATNGDLLAVQPPLGVVGAQLAHHLLRQGGVYFLIKLNMPVKVVSKRVELARKPVAQLVD